jgi:hypothetical protein
LFCDFWRKQRICFDIADAQNKRSEDLSPEEAVWLGNVLLKFETEMLSPLINLGSSSIDYRKQACTEIETHIFTSLIARGVKVYHADLKDEAGIDIVGDICDKNVQEEIYAKHPRALLCNNILEHVIDREAFCCACYSLLPKSGLLFVSVPFMYPYHPDPIDTGFRSDIERLKSLLKDFEFVEGEIITFGNYMLRLKVKKKLLIRDAYLVVAGFVRRDKWKVLLSNYRFLVSPFKVTCAVFRKR